MCCFCLFYCSHCFIAPYQYTASIHFHHSCHLPRIHTTLLPLHSFLQPLPWLLAAGSWWLETAEEADAAEAAEAVVVASSSNKRQTAATAAAEQHQKQQGAAGVTSSNRKLQRRKQQQQQQQKRQTAAGATEAALFSYSRCHRPHPPTTPYMCAAQDWSRSCTK